MGILSPSSFLLNHFLGNSSGSFLPTSIAGLQLWLKADAGLTLSTAGFTGTGTTVAQSGNTLTGVATKFLSECVIGDNITGGNGLNGNVTAIASDTSLTLDSSATIGAETPYTITPVAGVSDRVTTWADQSGLGHDAAQATNTRRPAKIVSAQNGLPIIRFDGGNDNLKSTFSLSSPSTTYVVVKPRVTALNTVVYDGGGASNRLLLYISTGPTWGFFNEAPEIDSATPTVAAHVLVFMSNGASSVVSIDGANEVSGSTGTQSITSLMLGAQYDLTTPSKTDMAEILSYAGAHSAAQRASVRNYMNGRWAIY